MDEETGLKQFPFIIKSVPRLHWEDPSADHLMTHEVYVHVYTYVHVHVHAYVLFAIHGLLVLLGACVYVINLQITD